MHTHLNIPGTPRIIQGENLELTAKLNDEVVPPHSHTIDTLFI